MPSSKEMSGVDPPGEGHSRYDQIGAHVLHGVVMRAQTIGELLRQQSEGRFHRFVSIHAGPRTMDLRTFPKRPLFQIVTLTLRSWFGPGSTRCLLSALLPSLMGGYP